MNSPLRSYRPKFAGLLAFALLAACASNVPPAPSVVAQNPPMVVDPPKTSPATPAPEQPKPAPIKPTPIEPEVKTGITVPAANDDHSLIRLGCAFTVENAGADRFWRFWEVGADGWQRPTDRVKVEPLDGCRSQLIATAEPGNYLAECFGDGAPYTAPFKVGNPAPPEPEKPLSELAGKDAPALAAFYAATLKLLPQLADAAEFWQAHDAGLRLRNLEANGARQAIEAKLLVAVPKDGPVDATKAEAAINAIVKELGSVPPPSPSTVTAAVYVYEKDATAIPPGVQAGINRLNRERKIVASIFEEDTTDGTGDVPEQFKAAKAAATQAGLPALVVLAGATVVKVVPKPTTEAAVMEAVP